MAPLNYAGLKYQTFEGDKMVIKRAVRYASDNSIIFKDEEGLKSTIKIKDLSDKYVMITPDAFVNFIIAEEELNGVKFTDLYVCVNKTPDTIDGNMRPSLIMRQNYFSKFKNVNLSALDSVIYVGECATIINSTPQELEEMLTFDRIRKSYSVSIYLDDKLSDILDCVPNKFKKDVVSTLAEIKTPLASNVEGVTSSLEEFMVDNNFMDNFRAIFNILSIDFPIVLGDESYNSDGDIVLNDKQKKRFEDTLRRYITDIKVIKYDKDIDVSQIVSVQHSVVCDSNDDIFIIAYTIVGYYNDDGDVKLPN